jgi:invasion protein IalB
MIGNAPFNIQCGGARRRRIAGALVWVLVLAMGPAIGQQRTLAIYGDWTLSCVKASGTGASKSCGLVQAQKIQGQVNPLSQISVGRSEDAQPLRIGIEIRSNAWVPSGVRLLANDGRPAIAAAFKWCTPTRCFADADLSDADLKRLRAQTQEGQVAYKTALQGDVSIPMSFNGFGEALDALQKQ